MRRPQPSAIGNSQWMLSFADLLSLILTFFVLIYSMAQPMQQGNIFKNDFDSLKHPESDINFSSIKFEKFNTGITSEYLENVFEAKENSNLNAVKVESEVNRLILSIPNTEISEDMIAEITEALRVYDNRKHVYSNDLETSRSIAERLSENGIATGLGFYEDVEVKDRIDIIIYL